MKVEDASGTYNFAGEMDSKPFYKEILWKLSNMSCDEMSQRDLLKRNYFWDSSWIWDWNFPIIESIQNRIIKFGTKLI